VSVLDRIGGDCTSFWGVVCLMEGDVVGVLYVGGLMAWRNSAKSTLLTNGFEFYIIVLNIG